MSENSSRFITEVVEQQRDMVRAYLTNSLVDGVHPRTAALEVVGRINKITKRREGGIVGLTSGDTAMTQRALAELRSGDPAQMRNYLNRKLRDKRFDSLVKRAIREGKPVPASDARKIIGRLTDRALFARGETIARTEGITAMRAGRHQGFFQLVDSGAIEEEQIERTWDSTGEDGRTRPDHIAMDGQKVTGLTRPFLAPDGSKLMYPGDKSLGAGARQVVNCRCFERVRVNYIGD